MTDVSLVKLLIYLTDDVKFDSGKNLKSSGDKPLPEAMLTKFYDAICRH